MSDEENDIEEEEENGEEESEGSKKKLFMIIGIAVFVLLVGGVAGAYFMGAFGGNGDEEEVVVEIPPGPPAYHEFPQLIVDLKKKKGARTSYIKLKVVVEIVTRDLPLLQAKELKIVDKIHSYLRSLPREAVTGGAGTEHMRSGISSVITEVMGDVKFEGVLFREILLQ